MKRSTRSSPTSRGPLLDLSKPRQSMTMPASISGSETLKSKSRSMKGWLAGAMFEFNSRLESRFELSIFLLLLASMLFVLFALRHSLTERTTRAQKRRKKIFSRRKLCRERNHNEKLWINIVCATIMHGMPRARNVQSIEELQRVPSALRQKLRRMPDKVLGNAGPFRCEPLTWVASGTRRLENGSQALCNFY